MVRAQLPLTLLLLAGATLMLACAHPPTETPMDPDLDLSGPRAALVAAPMVRLPFGELPPTVGLGQQAFDEAEAAYDAGDDLTAARGFVRAGLLWCEHRNGMVASELPALSAAAWQNAATAFAAGNARAEGRTALTNARRKDAANGALLEGLARDLE
ncbi:MAG: hypothetical protein IT383_20285 [Deltaproteobacteria bacterium]|nr:hypothetical protein [Deltaproteobacteria bacterium]